MEDSGLVKVPLRRLAITVGLGTLVKRVLARLGAPACRSCHRRAAYLDSLVTFVPAGEGTPAAPLPSASIIQSSDCWHFRGRCTGWGTRQCVTGPEEQSPDALIIEQCCSGWFQYPWIEVCPGTKATRGCGFCLW